MPVPGQSKPTGQGINPCFFWDNSTYMLGFKKEDAKPERTAECFEAFKTRHLELKSVLTNDSVAAVCAFLEKWNPDDGANYPILLENGFGVFQISGKTGYIHQESEIQEWWRRHGQTSEEIESGTCLVTGKKTSIARLHEPKIKTFDPKGSLLVSFNERAYESYGKEQGQNSPISDSVVFAYCNALNHLLTDERRRFRLGADTCIFWTDKPSDSEDLIPFLVSSRGYTEDEKVKSRLHNVLEKLSRGQLSADDLGGAQTKFDLVGLSPNASRLSIRFWHTATLGDLAANLQKHFNHLRIVREWDNNPATPSAFQLLRETVRKGDDIPPLLSGALMRAILLGTRYPEALYTTVMRRVKMERNLNYLKASIIKAFLTRNILIKENDMPLEQALDINRPEKAYHLGRLFAVLEQAQRQAHEFKLERTIRESYYGSACATPASIFPRIQTLYTHHLRKLSPGSRKYFEDWVLEIEQKIRDAELYPKTLTLHEQGMFAVGYYHQKHAFKKNDPTETPDQEKGE